MSRPNHCPNCGAALEGEKAAVGIHDDRSGDCGYDCYCRASGWSGDIIPDEEQEKYRKGGADPSEPEGGRAP